MSFYRTPLDSSDEEDYRSERSSKTNKTYPLKKEDFILMAKEKKSKAKKAKTMSDTESEQPSKKKDVKPGKEKRDIQTPNGEATDEQTPEDLSMGNDEDIPKFKSCSEEEIRDQIAKFGFDVICNYFHKRTKGEMDVETFTKKFYPGQITERGTDSREQEWISPKKTAKVSENEAPMEVTTENRFEQLSEVEGMEEEGGAEKEETPPPIVFQQSEVDWPKIHEILINTCSEEFEADMKMKLLYVNLKSVDDYRKATLVLQKRNIPFHTFQLLSEKPIKVVLKGLPSTMKEEIIQADLERRKFPISKVKQFSRRRGDAIEKLPIFLLELKKTKEGRAIHGLNNMLSVNVKIEKFAPKKRVIQCYRCQEYGHSQHLCSNPERCCKCGQHHRSKECPLKPEEKPKCIFCSLPHVSSYRGCPVYKKRYEAKKQQAKPAAKIPTPADFPKFIETEEDSSKTQMKPLYSDRVKKKLENPPTEYKDIINWIQDPKIKKFLNSMVEHVEKIRAAKTTAEKFTAGFKAAMTLMRFAESEE